jgi:hypothetical protein
MSFLTPLFSVFNTVANVFFAAVFAPVAMLPGWLSLTLISAVLGVVIFVIFMYTANRSAFSAIIDTIVASILAVFLFRDNIAVTMRSEGKLLVCSVKLLWYSLFPVLVMSMPLVFVLAQMAMWYQFSPPVPGEETVQIRMQLQDMPESWPEISLEDNAAVRVVTGPVRVFSRGEVYWEVQPLKAGNHELSFRIGDASYTKAFSAGEGFVRLSPLRPGARDPFTTLLYPLEKPFQTGAVRSILIDYPGRASKIHGSGWWLLSFCIISMIFALLSKPFIRIRT